MKKKTKKASPSSPSNVPPYQELGNYIELLRRQKFRSALAFFNGEKRSFSYRCFIEYERGESLPPIDTYLEIIKALGAKQAESIYQWVRVQMPNASLRALFDPEPASLPKIEQAAKDAKKSSGETLENTWVFNGKDLKLFLQHPEIWEFCQILSLNYPAQISWLSLGLQSRGEILDFCSSYLTRWSDEGRIEWTGTDPEDAVKILYQQIYIPKNQEWLKVRQRNCRTAVEAFLKSWSDEKSKGDAGEVYYTLLNRAMTPEQIQSWRKQLEELESRFFKVPYENENIGQTTQVTSYLSFFGTRTLKIKE